MNNPIDKLSQKEKTNYLAYLNKNLNSVANEIDILNIKLTAINELRIKACYKNNLLEALKKDTQYNILFNRRKCLYSEHQLLYKQIHQNKWD